MVPLLPSLNSNEVSARNWGADWVDRHEIVPSAALIEEVSAGVRGVFIALLLSTSISSIHLSV